MVALSVIPQPSHAGVFEDLVAAILKLTDAVMSLDNSVNKLTAEVDTLNNQANNISHFLETQTPIAFDLIANFTAVLNHGAAQMADAIHPLGHAADVVTNNVGITALYVVGTAVGCYVTCKLLQPVAKTLYWVTTTSANGVRRRWATYRARNHQGRLVDIVVLAPGGATGNTEVDTFPPDTVLIVDPSGAGALLDEQMMSAEIMTSDEGSDEGHDELETQRRPLMSKKMGKKKHRKHCGRQGQQRQSLDSGDRQPGHSAEPQSWCSIL